MNYGTSAQSTNVLTSWKDIARYMGKGVRTVQRWEQDFGLPVRRPQGSNKKAVLARPRDLDAWVALRCGTRAASTVDSGAGGEILRRTSDLRAEIETSRQLRASNQELMAEIRTALQSLQQNLFSFKIQS